MSQQQSSEEHLYHQTSERASQTYFIEIEGKVSEHKPERNGCEISEVKRRGAKLEHAPSLPVWARVQLAASSQEWVAALGMQNVNVSYP